MEEAVKVRKRPGGRLWGNEGGEGKEDERR